MLTVAEQSAHTLVGGITDFLMLTEAEQSAHTLVGGILQNREHSPHFAEFSQKIWTTPRGVAHMHGHALRHTIAALS